MARRRICAVTGSRADYGMLYWVLREIRDHPALELQLAVTGMHLAPRFGDTWRVIKQDGFQIDARVDLQLEDDTLEGVTKAVGRGVIGFAEAFRRLEPDIVLVLGDRFEIFAAAQAALLGERALAHIAGGDVTEGSLDDAMRHAITKMAQLHFVTSEQAAARVRQLGEDPAHVFNTGSPGLDYLKRIRLLPRRELEAELDVRFRSRNLLVTFHPATLEPEPPSAQFAQLLEALDTVSADSDTTVVFTRPNADPGNESIARMIDGYLRRCHDARAFVSLGQLKYLSLMAQCDTVVGNSSSGFYEAPSLKVPTVNIGERQKGRIPADSVISCRPIAAEIVAAIRRANGLDCSATVNPYGDGESAARVAARLAAAPEPRTLLKKKFFDAG